MGGGIKPGEGSNPGDTLLGLQQLRVGGRLWTSSLSGCKRRSESASPPGLCARASACPSLPGAPRQFPPPLTF